MPTVFSHPALALSLKAAFREKISWQLLLTGILFSVLPDFDVIGFKLGVPYESFFGHRGFFHSISFGISASLLTTLVVKKFRENYIVSFLYLSISIVSHGFLDACTSGGLGVALFSPFDNQRIFFSSTPIRVSPLSLNGVFSERFLTVLASELKWVWGPSLFIFVFLRGFVIVSKMFTKFIGDR